MNVFAILVLIAVILESISASRRIVFKSPSQKFSVGNLPSSNVTRKTNDFNENPSSNVSAMPENSRKPATKIPAESDQQPSKNDLGKMPTTKSSLPLERSFSVKNAKNETAQDAITKPTPVENSTPSIPYLEKGKVIVVKGQNGKIFVDDVFLFDYDDELKKGKLSFRVSADNDVSVNGRLVLRKRPEDALIIPLDPNINEEGITTFQVRVEKYGYLYYTSNKGLAKRFAAGK